MGEEFKLEVVNPEKSFLSKEDVIEVVVPAFEGEMGILKDHISIISFLKPGIIKVYSKIGEEKYYVKSTNKFVPNFLINKNYNIDNAKDVLDGFKIVGDYLEKTILKTIGINYPNSRLEFFNSIKNLDLSDPQNMKL